MTDDSQQQPKETTPEPLRKNNLMPYLAEFKMEGTMGATKKKDMSQYEQQIAGLVSTGKINEREADYLENYVRKNNF